MSHPLDWRREVMVMTEDGEVCRICGWREDSVNDPEIYEAHLDHILAAQQVQLTDQGDESNRYRYRYRGV